MLNQSVFNMSRILSEEEKLEQLDQLWDMYSTGVNRDLFNELCVLSVEGLAAYETNNVFHEIMIDFIIDYRKAYNNL